MEVRILIIDDDAQVVGSLLDFVEMIGQGMISCDYAHEVLKAQSLTSANQYDLIITDFHMPFQNGMSFVKALRTQSGLNQKTEVIMISGFTGAIEKDIPQIPKFTLMEKPVCFQTLENRIRSLMTQKPKAVAR
ncbi:MAG: response regulator transcription factor [Oligoflexus sp.]